MAFVRSTWKIDGARVYFSVCIFISCSVFSLIHAHILICAANLLCCVDYIKFSNKVEKKWHSERNLGIVVAGREHIISTQTVKHHQLNKFFVGNFK